MEETVFFLFQNQYLVEKKVGKVDFQFPCKKNNC